MRRLIPRIPKELCNQSLTINMPTGEKDKYGKQQVGKVEIERAIVQPQTIYSGTNNNRQVTANAVVFLFAGITTPFPTLDRSCVGWHITFEGKDYAITNLVDNREPYSNEVYSYELEVM